MIYPDMKSHHRSTMDKPASSSPAVSIPTSDSHSIRSSKMSQMFASPKKTSTLLYSPSSPTQLTSNLHQTQTSTYTKSIMITFNCPKPNKQCPLNKSAAYHHTPPPSKVLPDDDEDEDEDEDDDKEDYDDEDQDDQESDFESDDDLYSSRPSKPTFKHISDDEQEGVFLSD